MAPKALCSLPFTASSTQHMWELVAGSRTALVRCFVTFGKLRTSLETSEKNMTHSNTIPRSSQYLTHAHSYITQAVAAKDSCGTCSVIRALSTKLIIGNPPISAREERCWTSSEIRLIRPIYIRALSKHAQNIFENTTYLANRTSSKKWIFGNPINSQV